LLRTKFNEYYIGHFLQTTDNYKYDINHDSSGSSNHSKIKYTQFEKIMKASNRFFYLGEDRISKNFCRGEFNDNKTNGIAYLQKPTYYMKGIFKDSHLKDGEIKYVNHIGDSILVKTKVNSKSEERGYTNGQEPDFSKVLQSLIKSKNELNLMDIS
jgi:hypothetical protein